MTDPTPPPKPKRKPPACTACDAMRQARDAETVRADAAEAALEPWKRKAAAADERIAEAARAVGAVRDLLAK